MAESRAIMRLKEGLLTGSRGTQKSEKEFFSEEEVRVVFAFA